MAAKGKARNTDWERVPLPEECEKIVEGALVHMVVDGVDVTGRIAGLGRTFLSVEVTGAVAPVVHDCDQDDPDYNITDFEYADEGPDGILTITPMGLQSARRIIRRLFLATRIAGKNDSRLLSVFHIAYNRLYKPAETSASAADVKMPRRFNPAGEERSRRFRVRMYMASEIADLEVPGVGAEVIAECWLKMANLAGKVPDSMLEKE